jgi:hypothetical protein
MSRAVYTLCAFFNWKVSLHAKCQLNFMIDTVESVVQRESDGMLSVGCVHIIAVNKLFK